METVEDETVFWNGVGSGTDPANVELADFCGAEVEPWTTALDTGIGNSFGIGPEMTMLEEEDGGGDKAGNCETTIGSRWMPPGIIGVLMSGGFSNGGMYILATSAR